MLPHRVTHPLLSQVAALVGGLPELGQICILPPQREAVQSPGEKQQETLVSQGPTQIMEASLWSSQISSCVRHSGLYLSKRWSHSSIEEIRFEKERRKKGNTKQTKTEITGVIYIVQ